MTPATPADLRRLDDEAFVPADPVQETAEAFVGTITGRMKASEPNLSPAPRDVPGSRAATVGRRCG